jgi:hypothetical protein
MYSYQIAAITFLVIFGGASAGFLIQRLLPNHHLSSESRSTVHLAAGLIGTLAALILGLMVSSSKDTHDKTGAFISEMSAGYVHVDRLLANYGQEAAYIRPILRKSLEKMHGIIWAEEVQRGETSLLPTRMELENAYNNTAILEPRNQKQRQLQSDALRLMDDMIQKRWVIQEVVMGGSISSILLISPVIFIAFITFIYALYAPRNLTVVLALLCCSLCIAIAVFLISELSSPLKGALKVSSKPVHLALDQMGRE